MRFRPILGHQDWIGPQRATVFLALFAFALPVIAAPISIGSQPTAEYGCVDPHPAWKTPTPGSCWVGPSSNSIPAPGSTYLISFEFEAPSAATLDLFAWADDTANIWLNGDLLAPRSYVGLGNCYTAPGCLPSEGAFFDGLPVLAGLNTLKFHVFQFGAGIDQSTNPTGVLWYGTITPASETPEPGTMLMAGFGFLAIAAWRRKWSGR